MIAIELVLAMAGVGLCTTIATVLLMRKRYQRHEQAWDAQLRIANETIIAGQRETAVAIAVVAAAQAEVLAAQIEINVARSMTVAAEDARVLALAMGGSHGYSWQFPIRIDST